MAELIDRNSLLANLNKFAPEHFNALVNDLIKKEPVATTESEIRAKVIDEAMGKLAEEICVGCGSLKDRKCTYKGSNCRVSKIMLEKTMKVLEQLKEE